MKAKVKRGTGFKGALNYVLDIKRKEEIDHKFDDGLKKPEIISTNMSAEYMQDFAKEFITVAKLRPDIQKPVWHCSLSLPENEKLSSYDWDKITRKFMDKMEFNTDKHQYLAVRHSDNNHDHIHIISNRVSLDSTVWQGQWEARKAIEATQQIEIENNLKLTKGFTHKLETKKLSDKEINMAIRIGEEPPRQFVQKVIDEVLKEKLTSPEFAERLQILGVNVKPNLASTGRMNGFSFEYNNIAFKGQDLGEKYKWSSLQKRGVSYEQTRDSEKLKQYAIRISERQNIAGEDGRSISQSGNISRDIDGRNANFNISNSELERTSGRDIDTVQQHQQISEEHTRRVIKGDDQRSIESVQQEIGENRQRNLRIKDDITDSKFFNQREYKNDIPINETHFIATEESRRNIEIAREKSRELEQHSIEIQDSIRDNRSKISPIDNKLEKKSIDDLTVGDNISTDSNDFKRKFKELFYDRQDKERRGNIQYNLEQSNQKRGRVDQQDIRSSREIDPTECLKSFGFDVKKDGQNHLSVELNGDQIYRITKKQDGHYVACDKYGNGVGDNIALIKDIKPDLSFSESVYKLHSQSNNINPIYLEKSNERNFIYDINLPKQVENERIYGRKYLNQERKISIDTINHAEKCGLLKYTDDGVLFVGYDDNQKIRNVTKRSIYSDNKKDFYGSDKQYAQILEGNNKKVWIVEGGVDALALHDLAKKREQEPPTVIISGGANVKSFLERESIQELIKDADKVTVALDLEISGDIQLKTDKGHQRQIARLGELVSDKEKIKQWKPSLENGKDLSQLLMKEVSAENRRREEQRIAIENEKRLKIEEEKKLKMEQEKKIKFSRGISMGR